MVQLLTRCCAPVLNCKVICFTMARLSAVIMRGSRRWRHSSTRCCPQKLDLTGMSLPESTQLRYTLKTGGRENPSACTTSKMNDIFVVPQQVSHAQMRLCTSSYPYYIQLLLIAYATLLVGSRLGSYSFNLHVHLLFQICITPSIYNSSTALQYIIL